MTKTKSKSCKTFGIKGRAIETNEQKSIGNVTATKLRREKLIENCLISFRQNDVKLSRVHLHISLIQLSQPFDPLSYNQFIFCCQKTLKAKTNRETFTERENENVQLNVEVT